ncbi:PRC-barrel domain-containing protein [Streptomyces sp. 6N223]|uniref:PRC-barrel domain-containing protein n=1 Tax=Streptomyces sp. 6N223 TaxID=3457412 RepID=UPI003FCF27B8
MLFSQAKGHKVVGLQKAETIARVRECAIAPLPPHVTAFRVRARGHGNVLMWENIEAFGPDAVTIRSPDMLQTDDDAPRDRADPRYDPIGKQVITEAGEGLGVVTDIDFDVSDGRIHRLITKDHEIPAERLLGVGGFAIVVATDRT